MPSEDFYTIISQKETESPENEAGPSAARKFSFRIKLNPDHPVYAGHFPGNPVAPGVYQVQVMRELASLVLKKELVITRSDNIKFLVMIIPENTPVVDVNFEIREKEAGSWQVTGAIMNSDQAMMKFKGIMQPLKGS